MLHCVSQWQHLYPNNLLPPLLHVSKCNMHWFVEIKEHGKSHFKQRLIRLSWFFRPTLACPDFSWFFEISALPTPAFEWLIVGLKHCHIKDQHFEHFPHVFTMISNWVQVASWFQGLHFISHLAGRKRWDNLLGSRFFIGICYHLLAKHGGKTMAFTRIYFDLLES